MDEIEKTADPDMNEEDLTSISSRQKKITKIKRGISRRSQRLRDKILARATSLSDDGEAIPPTWTSDLENIIGTV